MGAAAASAEVAAELPLLKWQRCAGLPHKQENPFKNKKKCTFTCNIFLKNQQSVQKLAKI
jgi:hypothetical protein